MNESHVHPTMKSIELSEDDFGFHLDKTTGISKPVRRFTWRNKNCIEVQVITYGATISSIKMPDRNGVVEDIVMGFDNMDGYLKELNPYFGATVGRVANRIGNSKFAIDGVTYNVSANKQGFTLHGGFIGFDKVVWEHNIQGNSVVMSYLSKDKEEGFPGDLLVNIKFELTDTNIFKMDMKAYTTKPTFVNLTNHSYFNLAGHNKGATEVYKHHVQINADKITAVNNDIIPTGEFVPVTGTLFDLQKPIVLGDRINSIPGGGYDHNFCVNKTSNQIDFIAKSSHPGTGRVLQVHSNQPGVQFYTGNFLPKDDENTLIGKSNASYHRHGSFCFETQNYPDAANHPNFPKSILKPGEIYEQITHFTLSVE